MRHGRRTSGGRGTHVDIKFIAIGAIVATAIFLVYRQVAGRKTATV